MAASSRRIATQLAMLACGWDSPAWAGRPLDAEDASILDRGQCQLEAWIDRPRHATTGWIAPACNFGGIEWEAGFARTQAQGESRFSEGYVQLKAIVRPSTEQSPWTAALVAGTIRRPLEAYRGWGNPFLVAAYSRPLGESPFTLHANAGWARQRESGESSTPWALALEYAVGARAAVVAETFSQDRERPSYRLGARYSAIPNRLDLDLAFVTRPGGTREERFVSLGVTWQSGAAAP